MNELPNRLPQNVPPLETDAELILIPNVFAEIIAGRSPASFVYCDEQVAAFMDIQPINKGHVLVVPVQPVRFLAELDEAVAAHLFVVGQRVAGAVRASDSSTTGVFMFLADGATAGQEVPHVHLHVVPRFAGDGLRFTLSEHYDALPEREVLDEAALKIRTALGA